MVFFVTSAKLAGLSGDALSCKRFGSLGQERFEMVDSLVKGKERTLYSPVRVLIQSGLLRNS